MDETDDLIDQRALAARAAEERIRLQRAFGDNVAQRFLRLRGIMHDAILERYAAKQALRLTRSALLLAASQSAPPRGPRLMLPDPAPLDGHAPAPS